LPQRHLTINKKKVELSDSMWRQYCIDVGMELKSRLEKLVETSAFKNANDVRQKQMIVRMTNRIKTGKRNKVKNEYLKMERE